MKKLTAILQGCKFTDRLFGLREKEIRRELEIAKDECDEIEVRAQILYETCMNKLGEEEVCFSEVINDMIEAKKQIIDAKETKKVLKEIEDDLNAEVKQKD